MRHWVSSKSQSRQQVVLCRRTAVKTRSSANTAKQKHHEQDENSPAAAIAKTERRLSGLSLR